MKQWPVEDVAIKVTSPNIPWRQYPKQDVEGLDTGSIIHTMVGDLQRIMEYPKKGFQIKQDVPQHVHQAFNELISLGYTHHLMK